VYSKINSELFSVINTRNVQKHTKNINILFVITDVGQICGYFPISQNDVFLLQSLSMEIVLTA
jgi:hypothetical protein